MSLRDFGGDWTSEKLDRVRKYLVAYTTIFTRNPRARNLTTIYVDAFAGAGYRSAARKRLRDGLQFPELMEADAEAFLKGSARIALEAEPSFDRYLFVERDPDYVKELERLRDQFPRKSACIEIVQAEANSYLHHWCGQTDWQRCRAVVFLDPYGMQVEWRLIQTIAQTQAIDLWLLFPLGVAVNRLLTKSEPPPQEWAQALTSLFGTDDWHQAFYPRRTVRTLFGEEDVEEKEADFESIGRYFVDRLKTVFTRVAEHPFPLRNSRNVPIYLLCFAAGNPRGAPTAIKIAQDILG